MAASSSCVTTKHGTGRWLAVWALTIAVAVWLGRNWGSAPAPDVAERAGTMRAPSPRAAAPATILAPGTPGLDAAEVRAIVHDELARQLADLRPNTAVPAPAPEPSQLAPELAQRADTAGALIDRAIGAGRWTLDDRRQFALASAELPPPVQFELQRKLHVAINRGAVAIADGAPPFGPSSFAP